MRTSRVRLGIAAALLAAFAALLLQTLDIGLADNGDFTRLMAWIVSRPEMSAVNWPAAHTAANDARFYNFWIPLWHLDPSLGKASSSAALLWSPAAAWTALSGSHVLSLVAVGLIMRAALLVLLGIVLIRVRANLLVTIVLGAAFALMLSTADYAAYDNTFFAEASSGLYLLAALTAAAALVLRVTWLRIVLYLAALTLLSACKLQETYLWPLGVLLLLGIVRRCDGASMRRLGVIMGLAVVIGAAPIVNLWAQSRALDLFHYNDYNRVYHGMLEFADDREAALKSIGGGDPRCIGTIVFTDVGIRCARTYAASYSRKNALHLLAAHPEIIVGMAGFAADSMQDISLEYLGKYAIGDPRAVALPKSGPSSWISAEQRDFYSQLPAPHWDLWAAVKYRAFPRGPLLWIYLAVVLGFFIAARGSVLLAAFRCAGAGAIVVCATQLIVVVFGDGKEEIIKHLYLANVAFDASLILLICSLLTFADRDAAVTFDRRSTDSG